VPGIGRERRTAPSYDPLEREQEKEVWRGGVWKMSSHRICMEEAGEGL